MLSFNHIDEGLWFKATKEEVKVAADKKDLNESGLVTSQDKCQWKPVQEFIWCGFEWDTNNFRVSVTEEKRERIKAMVKEEWVTAKEMASLTGLIISCSRQQAGVQEFTPGSVSW